MNIPRLDPSGLCGGTLTGRSGVNLDAFGWVQSEAALTAWVIDGVSPVVFRNSAKIFLAFMDATHALKKALGVACWASLQHDLRWACSTATNKSRRPKCFGGWLGRRPLFSAALVQCKRVDKEWLAMEYAIYGDCVVAISVGDKISFIEYAALETLKARLNSFLGTTDRLAPRFAAVLVKKAVFLCIRALQIWLGTYRVLDPQNPRKPAIAGVMELRGDAKILIMSDGASWYLLNNPHRTKDFMNLLERVGVPRALEYVRAKEAENVGFGRLDDTSIVYFRLEGQ